MRSVDNISQELFDKIRSRVSSIKLGDTEGMQTTEPSKARFFEFQFKHRDLPIGAVTISLNEEGVLQVYFPNSMVEDADSGTADAWYGFLKELSKFSARNMLNYETHNVTKERLDKKDYQFLTQRSQDEVMENKMYGTHKKSFLDQGTAKIIIQHDQSVDETKMGARSRNIAAIYIENAEGERFKFANNYLPGARAMARHVSNEGHTRDERGTHIVEIMSEMQNLKTFVRAIKRDDYVTDESNEIIEAATDRYYGLKDTLKTLASANGYNEYFENWVPEAVEDEGDLEDLKQKLTREVYDDRLTDSLPSVRRAMKERAKVNEANMQDLIDFANSDDPIEVFDNPEDMAEIKNYMQFMKNSDMDVQRKNKSILVAIMKYLANNMTDDAAANALSEIDLMDKAQQKMAYQIAKKYLQGKVEVKAKKAKKDLFGKDKPSEDVTFEAYAQNMDMIVEGTWALPETEADAMGIARLMEKPLSLGDAGEDAIAAVGAFIGDDELYDDLGAAGDKDPDADARPIIMGWLMDHVDDYGPKFKEPMQMALDQINKTGPDQTQMTIPRSFGNKRTEDVDMNLTEGYEKEVIRACKKAGISCYFKDGILQLDVDDFEKAKEAIEAGNMSVPPMKDPLGGEMPMIGSTVDGGGPQGSRDPDVEGIAATMEEDPMLRKFVMSFEKAVYAGAKDPENIDKDDIKAALEEVLPDYIAGKKIQGLLNQVRSEDIEEGKMKDLLMHIEEMISDGASDEEIMKMHPNMNKMEIARIRKQMDLDEAHCGTKRKRMNNDIHEDDERLGKPMTDQTRKDIIEIIRGFDIYNVSYNTINDLELLYEALYGGFYGDIDDETADKFEDLQTKFSELYDKAAGDDKPYSFTAEYPPIPLSMQNEAARLRMEMVKLFKKGMKETDEVAESIAKMKAMAGVGSNMRSNHGIHEGEPGYQITPRSIVARQMRKLQDIEKK